MNAHAHRPLVRRQSRHSPLERFADWVNTKWQARRARRLEEETVVYLSAMDTKLLNDIGMDVGTLANLAGKPSTAETAKIVPLPRSSDRRTRS
jgi:uncharacterized protein YjiS (DUF1127 family)